MHLVKKYKKNVKNGNLSPVTNYIFLKSIYIFDFFSKCESGCLNCIEKPCEVCNLSEWSEWKNISSNCKINSKRFRNYFGRNCSNKKIEEQIKTYHNNCTCFYNNTNYQVYIFTFIYLKYSLDT